MTCKIAIFVALVAVARAGIVPVAPAAAPVFARIQDYDAVPQYTYAYDVQDSLTGDSKGQYETRNGDIVQGSYNVLEADGTRRVVDYTADPINGFNAVVSRQPGLVAAPIIAKAAPVVAAAPVIAKAAPVVAAPLAYTIPRAVATRLNVPVAAPLNYPAAYAL